MADLDKTVEYAEEKLSTLAPDEKDKDHIGLVVETGFLKDVVDLLKAYPKIVYCKDCNEPRMVDQRDAWTGMIKRVPYCHWVGHPVRDTDFCSGGTKGDNPDGE